MSLVVLRSWSDGKPPVVREIAQDSDKDSELIVIPDHHGTFITEEIPINKHDGSTVRGPVSNSKYGIGQLKFWNRKDKYNCNSSGSSPSPDSASTFYDHQEGNSGMGRQRSLSRESSIPNSPTTGSPPSSPSTNSRYKNLGPELAATIPKRQIIRQSWIRNDRNNVLSNRKKELSKSTPSLYSSDSRQLQDHSEDELSCVVEEDASEFGFGNKVLRRSTSTTINSNDNRLLNRKQRALSYIDSLFTDLETSVKKEEEVKAGPEEFGPASPKGLFVIENSKSKVKAQNNDEPSLKALDVELDDDKEDLEESVRIESSREMNYYHNNQKKPGYKNKKIILEKSSSPSARYLQSDSDYSPPRNDKSSKSNLQDAKPFNGSLMTEVPLHCLNPQVLVPQPYVNKNSKASPTQQLLQQHHYEDPNVQMRKNFCDELLNDNLVLKVPVMSMTSQKSPSPVPSMESLSMYPPPVLKSVLPTNQKPQLRSSQPMCSNLNHDGIIFFDEEEEFEHNNVVSDEDEYDDGKSITSFTSSMTTSERENSFEYMSVLDNTNINVKVDSLAETFTNPSMLQKKPEIGKRFGVDIGSSHARLCVSSNNCAIQIEDVSRALITTDGVGLGYKSICHSMSTKSKLVYKWRSKLESRKSACNNALALVLDNLYQHNNNNNDNAGECSQTLEMFFKYYAQLASTSLETSKSNASSPKPKTIAQWNLSFISGMDKKLIRDAAYENGLIQSMNDELRLVHESTAAAVMAYQFLKTLSQRQGKMKSNLGKSFISLNIGSTFIHSSGYEIKDEKLFVISSPQSRLFTSPEMQFILLLSRIFSNEFIHKYESRFTPAWIELLLGFDQMINAHFKLDSKPYLFLPISFNIEFYKCTGLQVPEYLEDNLDEGVSWDNNGALHFSKELLREWVQPIVDCIKTTVNGQSCAFDYILLSGGGAYLVQEIESLFPKASAFKVPNPENAVIYGLVNLDNVKITFKSPFSIGVGVMTPFDGKIHPKDKCVTRNGKQWCSDIWDNLIRKGQILTIGDVILQRTYVGAQPGQNVLVLPIFKSEADEQPKLVTSKFVEKCCELRFEIEKEKSWREVQLIIKCYESELAIIAMGNDRVINQVVVDF